MIFQEPIGIKLFIVGIIFITMFNCFLFMINYMLLSIWLDVEFDTYKVKDKIISIILKILKPFNIIK